MMDDMLSRLEKGEVQLNPHRRDRKEVWAVKSIFQRKATEAQIELGLAEYSFRTKNLEREFLKGFGKQLQFLKTTPQSFQIKYQSIRILQFEKFNYSIHYIIKMTMS
ncbi:MAG: hypothetical protein AAF348_01465 [Bacteroidota bacterium]